MKVAAAKKWLVKTDKLRGCWLLLMVLTLGAVALADSADPTLWTLLLICSVAAWKGMLVVDQLMGLRHAPRLLRGLMLAYFWVLPGLIALAWSYPETLRRLTTL